MDFLSEMHFTFLQLQTHSTSPNGFWKPHLGCLGPSMSKGMNGWHGDSPCDLKRGKDSQVSQKHVTRPQIITKYCNVSSFPGQHSCLSLKLLYPLQPTRALLIHLLSYSLLYLPAGPCWEASNLCISMQLGPSLSTQGRPILCPMVITF